MKFIKKYWFKIVLVILLIIFVGSYSIPRLEQYVIDKKCRNVYFIEEMINEKNKKALYNCMLQSSEFYDLWYKNAIERILKDTIKDANN